MSGLCLALGLTVVALDASAVSVQWTHSVERTGWAETYRLVGDTVVLETARIQGSGAGMDPPPGAVLMDGWWHYRPALPPQREIRLTWSPFTEDYTICAGPDRCDRLAAWLGAEPDSPTVVRLGACRT